MARRIELHKPRLALTFFLMQFGGWLVILFMAITHPALAVETIPPLDDLFAPFAQPNSPSATVLVAQNGKVLFEKSYGLADVAKKIPATPETNYRLASVTKQFTAMAIMILADRGKLSVDDPITNYFAEFPACGATISIRHLLNHTSGMRDYEDLIPAGTTLPVLDLNVLRLLLKQTNCYFPPGTQFRYSNSGYALLALIVEKVSGQTFAGFLQNNIFQPLRLKTTLAYESGLRSVPHRAFGASENNGVFTETDQSLTSSVLGDGGIYSNVRDLLKWDRSLYTTKLVSRKTLRQIFTPNPINIPGSDLHYGYGWFLMEYRGLREVAHSGDSLGFTTQITRYPQKKFVVIILTNRSHAPIAEIPRRIADRILFAHSTP